MAPREASERPDGQNPQPNMEQGQRVLELLQDPQNPDNLKELKGLIGNRSWDDFLGMLKDIYLTHLDAEGQLQDEHEALKIKYSDLKKHLKQPAQEQTS